MGHQGSTPLPATIAGMKNLDNRVRHFALKANVSSRVQAWIKGVTYLGEKYGAFHTYPEPTGIWDIEDPETGKTRDAQDSLHKYSIEVPQFTETMIYYMNIPNDKLYTEDSETGE